MVLGIFKSILHIGLDKGEARESELPNFGINDLLCVREMSSFTSTASSLSKPTNLVYYQLLEYLQLHFPQPQLDFLTHFLLQTCAHNLAIALVKTLVGII